MMMGRQSGNERGVDEKNCDGNVVMGGELEGIKWRLAGVFFPCHVCMSPACLIAIMNHSLVTIVL